MEDKPRFLRIHFYLGPMCRTEVIDPKFTFAQNKNDILDKFGVAKRLRNEEERQQERNKYVFKHMNGGLIESNPSLINADRVLIMPREKYLLQMQKMEADGVKPPQSNDGKNSAPV